MIAERLEDPPAQFVNGYELTKWNAERLVASSDLPVRIARLSTCLGAERTGYVHRFGAIHQAIRWLARGLVPMLPAVDDARVDLISTDVAARWIARAAAHPPERCEVAQVAAGRRAISIQELVNAAVAHLRDSVPGWRLGQFEPPLVVDLSTFELFERSVLQSGNALFHQVLKGAAAFFPALLFSRSYQTTHAEHVWGGPLPLDDWRSTLEKVMDFGSACDWHRRTRRKGALSCVNCLQLVPSIPGRRSNARSSTSSRDLSSRDMAHGRPRSTASRRCSKPASSTVSESSISSPLSR